MAYGDYELPGMDASLAKIDGQARLAAAVVVRSIDDLCSDDGLTALDALAWWLDDGPTWLDAITEAPPPPEVALSLILRKTGGRRYERLQKRVQPK